MENCESDIVHKYSYLGLLFTECLDYSSMAKVVAQSVSIALGLLISRYKVVNGMKLSVFTRLYESLVQPIISYGAAIWGVKRFSCVEAVKNRAIKFFLGTNK